MKALDELPEDLIYRRVPIKFMLLTGIFQNYIIDKATVSRYMKSKLVTRYFHGNTWFINYDELEKVLLKKVRINSKLKTK